MLGWSKTTRHVEVDIVVRALLIFVDVSVFIFGAVDETAQGGLPESCAED